jgi:acetyl coenzyme A synthetase (ADP forming)-like protein
MTAPTRLWWILTVPHSSTFAYPAQYECDVVTRDGSTIHLRPLRSDDAAGLRALYERLSVTSIYFRFHAPLADCSSEVARLLRCDYEKEFVLIAEAGGRLSGMAAYFRNDEFPNRAEAAFTIADALQGHGVGTRMLEVLASIARDHQIQTFDAYVLHENKSMMQVFLDSGFEVQRRLEGGVVHVVLSLRPTPVYEAKAAQRSHTAAVASMKHFFEPSGVAVVGANQERGKIGSEILHNIIAGGFTRQLFAVHPSAHSIEGIPTYPRVTSIPGEVDLAVICVPCAQVSAVVDDCIAKRVKALVVISAGFGETGGTGRALERGILEKVRTAGIRMIGPNCMGVINTDRAVRLNATFSPVAPIDGRVAMSTQSGALGLAILDYVRQLNLGISTFVSVGNKADVSGNDLMQYWAEDPRTDVILLYLESFGNPRNFAQIARRVAQQKPIVAMKSGRSRAGARAASSHTGALAASDVVVDALFRQAGVIRTTTLEELFDVATLLAHQPLPAGSRIAIVSNAGGPAILAADACEAHRLLLSPLSEPTVQALREVLPAAAGLGNPVDMLASATPLQYERVIRLLLADENVDSLLVIYVPPLVTQPEDVAHAITAGAARTRKPVIANFISTRGAPPELAPIPSYRFPEAAITALAHAATYAAWRSRPKGSIPHFSDIHEDIVRRVVDLALQRGGGWLTAAESQTLVEAIGIATAAARLVANEDEAIAAAREIRFPVALKAAGPEIVHKSDIGGVRLDIGNEGALREAFRGLTSRVGTHMTAALVQQMVPGGVELLIGAVADPMFGPLIACGTGGVLVDLFQDTVFRLHPVTDVDANDIVESLKSAPLLRGYRGHAPVDKNAVVDALLRVSALLQICPEIQELDINPVTVLERGLRAVDVRVRVGHAEKSAPTRRVSY